MVAHINDYPTRFILFDIGNSIAFISDRNHENFSNIGFRSNRKISYIRKAIPKKKGETVL